MEITSKSSSERFPVVIFQASMSLCEASIRSTSCPLLISREKIPTGIFSFTPTCSAIFIARVVLPTLGRAAKISKFAGCIPESFLSISPNPVGIPRSPVPFRWSSSSRSKLSASASRRVMKFWRKCCWLMPKRVVSANSSSSFASASGSNAASLIVPAEEIRALFVADSRTSVA